MKITKKISEKRYEIELEEVDLNPVNELTIVHDYIAISSRGQIWTEDLSSNIEFQTIVMIPIRDYACLIRPMLENSGFLKREHLNDKSGKPLYNQEEYIFYYYDPKKKERRVAIRPKGEIEYVDVTEKFYNRYIRKNKMISPEEWNEKISKRHECANYEEEIPISKLLSKEEEQEKAYFLKNTTLLAEALNSGLRTHNGAFLEKVSEEEGILPKSSTTLADELKKEFRLSEETSELEKQRGIVIMNPTKTLGDPEALAQLKRDLEMGNVYVKEPFFDKISLQVFNRFLLRSRVNVTAILIDKLGLNTKTTNSIVRSLFGNSERCYEVILENPSNGARLRNASAELETEGISIYVPDLWPTRLK